MGVSYSGAVGGVLAALVLGGSAAAFASSDGKQGWTFVYGALAALFLLPVWASVSATPRRETILRASTGLALVVALGSFGVDYGVPLLMAPATALLAQAAGLIFPARRS